MESSYLTRPNEEPLVWIIIPTWNRSQDIINCINSLKNQIYKNFHILVIDNASEDDTVFQVRKRFPGVDIICLENNMGASYASNKGFKIALTNNADLILRLDSDTALDSYYLLKLVNTIKSDPEAGIVSGKIYFKKEPEKIWYTGGNLLKWNMGIKMLNADDETPDKKPIEVDLLPSTGMLITKKTIERLKGFDLDYLVYFEDFDFCLKAKKQKFKLFYVPDALIWHNVFSNKSTSWTAEQWNKSKMIFFRKHALNIIHKNFLILYAFLYTLFRSIIKKEDRGNRGPLVSALRGLVKGLRKPLNEN